VLTELEALVALVNCFAASSLETTRLAVELQGMSRISPHLALTNALAAKLPVVLTAEISATTAAAATDAAAAAKREEEEYAAAAAADPIFVRGVAKTPAQLEAAFPEGSGEMWYVVIRGREPGMYRTSLVFFIFFSNPLNSFHSHTMPKPTPFAMASPTS
jgi:hypothetical protein